MPQHPLLLYSHKISLAQDVRYQQAMEHTDAPFRQKLMRIMPMEIKIRKVAARLLLRKALRDWGYIGDLNIQLTAFGKPYIHAAPAFNISYTHGQVLLAISSIPGIGVDIEWAKPIDYKSMMSVMHPNEQKWIMESDAPMHNFYRIWTRKEAVLKALGIGLINELDMLDCTQKYVQYNGEGILWKTVKAFEDEYKVCLAAKEEIHDIKIISIGEGELFDI